MYKYIYKYIYILVSNLIIFILHSYIYSMYIYVSQILIKIPTQ